MLINVQSLKRKMILKPTPSSWTLINFIAQILEFGCLDFLKTGVRIK
jgi:hypothetical protein